MSGFNPEAAGDVGMSGEVTRSAAIPVAAGATTHYKIECVGPDGRLKWVEEFDNLVVTTGLNELIDKTFKGSGYTAAWYVGLTDGTPTAAPGDTMSSHAGWAEVTAYDEATRQALTLGSVSGGSANNSAAKATFTISSNGTTIGGAFLSTDDSKGASNGTLYGVGAFAAGDKTIDDDDTLYVTVTLTMTAS
jgi:hypothetical protein